MLEILKQIVEAGDSVDEGDKIESRLFGDAIMETINTTTDCYVNKDTSLCGVVQVYRELIMDMADLVKKRHVKRLHEKGRKYSWGTLFGDICYAEEQYIDFSDMVVEALLNYYEEIGEKDIVRTQNEAEMKKIRDSFDNRYMRLLKES